MCSSDLKAWVDSMEEYRLLPVSVYGDATGASRRSSASRTDWEIVREFLAGRARDYNTTFRVETRNPELKDRINCVSAIVSHTKRERRLRQAVDLRFRTGLLEKRCQWEPNRGSRPFGSPAHTYERCVRVSHRKRVSDALSGRGTFPSAVLEFDSADGHL